MTRTRTSLYESQAGSPESDGDSSDAKSVNDEKKLSRGRNVERTDEAFDTVEAK